MKIVAEMEMTWGAEIPPPEFINKQLCNEISNEINKLIKRGLIKVENDGCKISKLTIDINI